MTDLVLADDATGALECASLLAALGHDVAISLGVPQSDDAPRAFQVIDTESRHLPPAAATARLHACLAQPHRRVFKKTDSTLRGNIAAELAALGELVYVPAYPALGRTVRGGKLFVDGVPVSATAFGADPRQPIRSSEIAALFPPDAALAFACDAAELERRLGHARIVICDAESDAELAAIAAVLRQHAPLTPVASPAGFIRYWAGPARLSPTPLPSVRDWLVVCGSLHPQSRAQAQRAVAAGWRVLQSADAASGNPDAVALELAERSAAEIRRQPPSGILVMGGDTARALWRALGITQLTPLPEALPGIAVCRSTAPPLLFVTKAGGFGEEHLVEQLSERFS